MQPTDEIRRANSTARDLDVSAAQAESESEAGIDIVAALWRYRWAVIIPAALGLLGGLLLWSRLPETYEASARFLVESETPLVLEPNSADALSIVPGADVIRSQLFSSTVLSDAERFVEENQSETGTEERPMEVLVRDFNGSFATFAYEAVEFEPETEQTAKSYGVAIRLAVQHTNKELVELSAKGLSTSLQTYFTSKRNAASKQLASLLDQALRERMPKVQELEEKYREWRQTVNLQFGPDGIAINPYRIEYDKLQARRTQLDADIQAADAEKVSVEATIGSATDPRTAIDIVGQLLNKELVTPSKRARMVGIKDEDLDLRTLGFQEQLVPLIVERQKAAGQFGENHPSVRDLDAQIKYSKEQFEKLSKEFTDRVQVIINDDEKEREEAIAASKAVISTLNSKVEMLIKRKAGLDDQIKQVKAMADSLTKDEQENESRRRELEREVQLLAQLQEQMARINLTGPEPGLVLTTLSESTNAMIVGPSIAKCLGGGLFLGLLMGCALAYLLEGQAGTFRSAKEIESTLGVQILSHIPFDPGRRKKLKKGETDPYENLDEKLSVVHRPNSVPAEAVRACRTSLFFEANASGVKVLQVTSPLPSDGKTTIAGNLAASIAQAGKKVVIVDADLRRPQLSDNFGLQDDLGLTNVLNGDCDPTEVIHETPVTNLFVVPSGPIPVNPAEALTLPEMAEYVEWLRQRFDYVIIDTPPLLVVTDPGIVASLVDGVVVTVKIRRKSRANATEAINILRSVGARILGVVINASDDASGSDGYRGYGYYKYSRYASKYSGGYGYHSERRGNYSSSKGSSRQLVVVGGKQRPDIQTSTDDQEDES